VCDCRYNEHMQKLARNEACGRPKEAGLHIGKVRSGKSNRHELSPELRVAIQEKWEEVMLPVTGARAPCLVMCVCVLWEAVRVPSSGTLDALFASNTCK
jgi:hypothetical protein